MSTDGSCSELTDGRVHAPNERQRLLSAFSAIFTATANRLNADIDFAFPADLWRNLSPALFNRQ